MRISAFALLLLACVACTHAQREPSDLAEERSRYFVDPRAFPFGEIPPGARREALEAWRRTRRVASELTGTWKPLGIGSIGVKPPYASGSSQSDSIVHPVSVPRGVIVTR